MCQFFISLACCFVTILVQAQENVVENTIPENKALLENEVALDELIFEANVNSENNAIFKNETITERTQFLENGTTSKNVTTLEMDITSKNVTTSKNDEILESKKLKNNNSSLIGRIVNGTEAFLGQFPQQVSLRRTGSMNHFCGGSIVSLKYILTAAHCMFIENMTIKIPATSITIVAGNVLLIGESTTTQQRIVQEIFIHKKFNKHTLENDITLLMLEKPLVENNAIKVAKLPIARSTPGIFCEVFGWGFPSEEDKTVSNSLMFVKLPLLTQAKCRELLANVSLVPNGMLCAGYIEGGKDACQGDSGGGMLCNNTLTGVVSSGDGCARPRSPGVYTDIFFYRKWINTQIRITDLTNDLRTNSNSGSSNFVNIFWLVASLISAFLLSIYC